MEDFDALIEAAHGRGLRLILDLVPNHTSDQHPWFIEARSSRDNPKRDWYIWRDGRPDGEPPTTGCRNLAAAPGSTTRPTGQYYYHAFLAQQPDLNWRNPEVRQAIYDVMRFWLGKGRRRFSRRRDLAPDQGRRLPRQPAEPALPRRPAAA